MFGLSVKQSQGLGLHLLQEKGKYNAFLGTSLGKHLFSKENINKYFEWAHEYTQKFILVIDDYEERLNYIVFKQLSPEEALERALTIGKDLEKAYNSILSLKNNQSIKVIRTEKIFTTEKCMNITNQIDRCI